MKLIELHNGSRYIRTRLVAQKQALKTELTLAESLPPRAASIENFKAWLNEPNHPHYIQMPRPDGKSEPTRITGKECIDAYLRELRAALRKAEVPLNGEPLLCLSVPAYAKSSERKIYQDAITQAAREAGFRTPKLINEPDAVFEYFRLGRRELDDADTSSLCVLIIDFGGGTCNVSAVSTTRTGNRYQRVALAPVSADAPRAGGVYIDRALLSQALRDAGLGHVLTALAPVRQELELWWERHQAKAEALKRVVSENSASGEKRRLRVPLDGGLAALMHRSDELTIDLSGPELEAIVRNHWERYGIKQAVDNVLAQVREKFVSTAQRKDVAEDPRALITHVILAGGSSQLPGFKDVVSEYLAPYTPRVSRIGKDFPFAVSVGMALNELDTQGALDRTPVTDSAASFRSAPAVPAANSVVELQFIPEFTDEVCLFWRSHPDNDFTIEPLFGKGKNTFDLLEEEPKILSISVPRQSGGLRRKIEFQIAHKSDQAASKNLSGERLNLAERFMSIPSAGKGTLKIRVFMDLEKHHTPEVVLEVLNPDAPEMPFETYRIPVFLSVLQSQFTPPTAPTTVEPVEKRGKQLRQLVPLSVLCIDVGTATTTCVSLHDGSPLALDDLSNYNLPPHIVQPKLELVPRSAITVPLKPTVAPLGIELSRRKLPTEKVAPPAPPAVAELPRKVPAPTAKTPQKTPALTAASPPNPSAAPPISPVPEPAAPAAVTPVSAPPPFVAELPVASPEPDKAPDPAPSASTPMAEVPADPVPPPLQPSAPPPAAEPDSPRAPPPSPQTVTARPPAAKQLPPPGPLPGEPFTGSESSLIDHLIQYAKDAKYEYPDELLVTYYLSLKVRPLVVLAGPSGVGKSALARLVAESFGASYERGDALRMAVEAHWTDGRFLFGRRDAQGRFIQTAFHRLLRRASAYPDRLYHVLIDEMNLAHVEYYFAHILSAMEGDGWLDIPDRRRLKLPRTAEGLPIIRFCGTINVDETTQILSDKVIDRTNVIELEAEAPPERVSAYHDHGILQQKTHVPLSRIEEWRRTAATHAVPIAIREIWQTLAGRGPAPETTTEGRVAPAFGLGFGRRVVRDIAAFVDYAGRLDGRMSEHDAIDLQVKQRILPKLRGDNRIRPILDALASCLDKHQLKRSRERLERMRQQLLLEHFVTFWS